MEEKCGSAAICFVAFLPDILDSKAEGRNKYLELLLSVAEKFKMNPYRQEHFFIWKLELYIFFLIFHKCLDSSVVNEHRAEPKEN